MAFQLHVSIPYFSAIPDDVCTNVWSFSYVTLAPSNADWQALQGLLKNFYSAVYANTASSLSMANYALPANTLWKGYNLLDPIPRAPVFNEVDAIPGVTLVSSVLPPEAAVCVSFQGDLVSGAPQARRRGRIFLGCIGTAWTTSSTSTFPDLSATRRGTIATVIETFRADALAAGWTWDVWSQMDQALVPITNGWIDNAPDTQRRRGNAPSARTTWSI